MIDDNEIQRLAAMASTLRPDWPARSLATFLGRNLKDRAYGDVAVALAWICTRTKTETPRLLLEAGPWWKATVVEGGHLAPRPPRPYEACATCGRRESEHGSPWLDDHPFTPLSQAARGRIAARGAAQARAELQAAQARAHGTAPGDETQTEATEESK